MSIYDLKVKDIENKEISLSDYKGKVLLIVNTATKCGFTPQYKGLEELYVKYNAQGFEILDFPCNQFFRQAPGTDSEICQFRLSKFHITFKQFSKIEVNGDKEDKLYTYLKSVKPGNIKWNFAKFLVDRDGNVVERFGSMTKPEEIDPFVSKLL
jgi:glutathione peroxidase